MYWKRSLRNGNESKSGLPDFSLCIQQSKTGKIYQIYQISLKNTHGRAIFQIFYLETLKKLPKVVVFGALIYMQHLATLVEMSSSKFVVGTTLTFRNTF
jgi:hypothetical protein